jgi:CheY-like chemotaxis protein
MRSARKEQLKRPHRIRVSASRSCHPAPGTETRSWFHPDHGTLGRAAETRPHPSTILFVEDDPQVQDFGILILRGAGYNVATADSAAQALRVWERNAGQVDLLLTDMMLPVCSTGLELALRFRREKSRLPVIITSGFGPEIAGDEAKALEGLGYLRKPFTADELLEVVACGLQADLLESADHS